MPKKAKKSLKKKFGDFVSAIMKRSGVSLKEARAIAASRVRKKIGNRKLESEAKAGRRKRK